VEPARFPIPIFPSHAVSAQRALYPIAVFIEPEILSPRALQPNTEFEIIFPAPRPSLRLLRRISPIISILTLALGVAVPIPILVPLSKN
jgi:hypothetical protein